MSETNKESNFLFYSTEEGKTSIQIIVDKNEETIWATQKTIAEIFGVDRTVVTKHLKSIYKEGELEKNGTSAKFALVQKEGERDVKRNIEYYNLDSIISVGYRVNSTKATRFRIWATKTIREYLIKGFVLDDDRLKQGKNIFDKDYFEELLERIREIRASERRFYQKITDLYTTASDYDKKNAITRKFFATVQNKLEYAITKKTAPEIIKSRADSKKPNMGLTSWKNEKKRGKILKSDVSVAKNYLTHDEITELNILVNMYLDFAELQAKRKNIMTMDDWANKLDSFLEFNEYDLLNNAGKIQAKVAKKFAEYEYTKFRVIQDIEYQSDFDKMANELRNGNIPIENIKIEESLSDFNQSLKTALDTPPPKNLKK